MARPKKIITEYKVCETCRLEFFRPIKFSSIQWAKTRFCNKKCSSVWLSKIKRGISAIWNIGRKHTQEQIEKNRLAHIKPNAVRRQKGYYAIKSLERYARLKGAIGSFSLEEWNELKCEHNFRCVYCGKPEKETKLTKDHIIPITKGGTNFISNIQPLCQSCNSSKGNRLYS